MTSIEKWIIFTIVAIIVAVGVATYNDDRPVRCFEGFKYKVGTEGELRLMTTGKSGTPVRCNS